MPEKSSRKAMHGQPPHHWSVTVAKRLSLVVVVSAFFSLGALTAFSAGETTVVAGPSGVVAAAAADGVLGADAVVAPALGAVAAAGTPAPAPPRYHIIEGSLREGSTLASIFRSRGVPAAMAFLIGRELSPHFDFRQSQPGHTYRLTRDASGEFLSFDYHTAPTEGYRLLRVGNRYTVERQDVELVPRPAMIAGIVASNLYQAIVDLGEQGQLARDFADVFAWDIDFQRMVRPGDAFQIVYERLHQIERDGSETYVRPGRILAARYDGGAGRLTAIYFEPEQGRGGYYQTDGRSLEGEFLMSPLRHGRITSTFSQARRHPILKVTRPHPGIDYAAPAGTPVWAVAAGEVIYRARAGSSGNLVKVRHRNGYVSHYAHLSHFAKDLKVGSTIQQKQVVGFVGSTGLATGPHVCFRVKRDGEYVNPARLRSGARAAIPVKLVPTYTATRDMLLAELDGGAIFATASSEATPLAQ